MSAIFILPYSCSSCCYDLFKSSMLSYIMVLDVITYTFPLQAVVSIILFWAIYVYWVISSVTRFLYKNTLFSNVDAKISTFSRIMHLIGRLLIGNVILEINYTDNTMFFSETLYIIICSLFAKIRWSPYTYKHYTSVISFIKSNDLSLRLTNSDLLLLFASFYLSLLVFIYAILQLFTS